MIQKSMRQAAVAVAVLVGAVPTLAHADGFDGQRFVPAAGAAGGFQVERPIVPKHLGFGAGLFLNYGFHPVVERDLSTGREIDQPLRHAFALDLLASIAFFNHLELAVHLPVDAVYIGDRTVIGGQPIQATAGVGDLRVVPKIMFWRDGTPRFNWAIGVMAPISFPTGDEASLRGSGGFVIDPRLLLGIGVKRLDFTLNAGYRWRSADGPANLYGPGEITYGLAATYTLPVWRDRIDISAEVVGGYNHDAPGSVRRIVAKSPLELLAGIILRPHPEWSIYAGGGPGLTSGIGTPDFRVFAGVRYAHRLLGRRGYRDSDHDGVNDANDRCPNTPEDRDGFEDDDGCPERDNDHDGISDAKDRCRNEPEDRDGFEDDDGCPDRDNDRDGIYDEDDECPDAPGPSTRDEGNGCPEKGYVVVQKGKLIIFGKVRFETGSARLTRSSEDLVHQIAVALRTHPEIRHVEVQGHTDNVGGRDVNEKLSQARAESVRDALVKDGVDRRRLTARGYGEAHPVASNSTRGGRAKNRRVEFVANGG